MSAITDLGGLTRVQAHRWRNATFVVFLLPGLALASWVARVPAVRDSLQASTAQMGLLLFGIAIGSIVGISTSSHATARFGARPVMVAGIGMSALGVIVAGLGASVGPYFFLSFAGLVAFGIGAGLTDVAMNVSGAANERVLGRTVMPIFHAFFSFGTMLGAGLGALAELAKVPVLIHMSIVAAILLAGVLVAIRYFQSEHVIEQHRIERETSQDASHPGPGTLRSRLGAWLEPRTLLIGLIVLGAAFSEGSANDWLGLAMVDGHHVENWLGALVFGLFVTAMTGGRLAGVKLLDRFGRVPVLRGSFLLAAISLLVLIFVPNPIVAAIAAVGWGLGSALGFPVGMSAAADDPARAAARVGVVATIGYFAFLVGPPVIGFIGDRIGLLLALLVVLVLVGIGAVVAGAAHQPTPTDRVRGRRAHI
jgi:MFS family permease